MRTSSALGYIVGLGFTALAVPALAADLPSRAAPPVFVQPEAAGFDVTIGAGPAIQNRFPGSSQTTVLPTFHLSYRKAGEPEKFYAADDAFDIAVYENPFFAIGPAANYIQNRGLSGGFQGLHTIGGTVELGGFVEVYPVPNHVRIRGEILQGVTGSKGLVGNIGADGFQRFGPFEVSIGPRVGFGNSRYASQYFSVTPFEAGANGLVNAYQASGGLTSVGAYGSIRYDINRRYSVLAFGGYNRLVDSVGSSPVVTRIGTRDQYIAGATLNYTFGFKGFGILGY